MCPNPGPHCWACDNTAKYKCPKCEVRSCSLQCVQRHKTEAECDGIRDKVKYLPINKFTDLDVVSDFRLLEEVSKQVDKCVVTLDNRTFKKRSSFLGARETS